MGMADPSGVARSMVRGGDGAVEGDVIVVGRQRQHVGADLVGDIAVGSYAIGAHQHGLDIAALEQRPAAPSAMMA